MHTETPSKVVKYLAPLNDKLSYSQQINQDIDRRLIASHLLTLVTLKSFSNLTVICYLFLLDLRYYLWEILCVTKLIQNDWNPGKYILYFSPSFFFLILVFEYIINNLIVFHDFLCIFGNTSPQQ